MERRTFLIGTGAAALAAGLSRTAFAQDKPEEAGRIMFKVKLGQPRNKNLLRMMEDPERRRAIDKAELSFYSDA